MVKINLYDIPNESKFETLLGNGMKEGSLLEITVFENLEINNVNPVPYISQRGKINDNPGENVAGYPVLEVLKENSLAVCPMKRRDGKVEHILGVTKIYFGAMHSVRILNE
jgi:hypothetical protein